MGEAIARWRLALVLAAGLATGCVEQTPEAEAPPPGVLVAPVTTVAVRQSTEFIGQTVAVNDATLRAQVEGYLLERRFEEGQDVADGDLLFVIDPAFYQAETAAAEGKVAEVNAALKRAQQDVARQENLVKQAAASKQRLEEAQAALLQSQAQLVSAEAQLQRARLNLGHTQIKAPFDGRIGRAFASIGDLVSPGKEELARLVELDPIYVNFSVSEGDIIETKRRYQEGDMDRIEDLRVELRLPDGSRYEHTGRIDFFDNVVDRKTGTVIVRARFPNPDRLLVPGLFVRTEISREETSDRLVIPQASIQEDQAGRFVLVVGPEEKVELRRVKTGAAVAGALVVLEGLEPDERVIVEGIQKVRPGIVVEAKVAPNPNAGNAPAAEQGGS